MRKIDLPALFNRMNDTIAGTRVEGQILLEGKIYMMNLWI